MEAYRRRAREAPRERAEAREGALPAAPCRSARRRQRSAPRARLARAGRRRRTRAARTRAGRDAAARRRTGLWRANRRGRRRRGAGPAAPRGSVPAGPPADRSSARTWAGRAGRWGTAGRPRGRPRASPARRAARRASRPPHPRDRTRAARSRGGAERARCWAARGRGARAPATCRRATPRWRRLRVRRHCRHARRSPSPAAACPELRAVPPVEAPSLRGRRGRRGRAGAAAGRKDARASTRPASPPRRAIAAACRRRRRPLLPRRASRRAPPCGRAGARGDHSHEPIATLLKVMATYRDLLNQVRAEIDEIRASDAAARDGALVFVDVRERDEWDEGHIPGALHAPRNNLESRVEGLVPGQGAHRRRLLRQRIALGVRRAHAGRARLHRRPQPRRRLHGLEAERLSDAAAALAPDRPARALQPPPADPRGRRGGPAEAARREGAAHRRRRPRLARVALPRRGGRRARSGSSTPTSSTPRTSSARSSTRPSELGEPKVASAKATIEALNPDVDVVTYEERLTSENVDRILADGWDVIVDGADNFPTRYLVNDASVWHGIPVVHGSIYRFEGQVTVFKPQRRAVLPLPLPAAAAGRAGAVAARRAACSASCPASSARCRRTRR